MTCASLASLASLRPISTAALPPTPASTSSNTNVGTGSAPAGCPVAQRQRGPPRVGGEPDLNLVSAVRAEFAGGQDGRRELRVRHGQGGKLAGDLGREASGRCPAQRGELPGPLGDPGTEPLLLLGEPGDPVVVAVELGEPAGGLLGPAEHRSQVTGGRLPGDRAG